METTPVRVLLVEDNPADARFLSIQLSASDPHRFKLTHVERLSAALEYLQRTAADVILLDLSLPDAHGLETVRKIQSVAADIPVVVLTGFSDESFALQAVREGAQDYLVKGQLDSDLLARSMRYAIERHRLLRGQKLAERALKASEEFARNIIDSSLDMIIAVDNERRIIQFNRAAEQAFGYSRTEVLGRDVGMLYADSAEGARMHRLTLESGRCVQEVLNRRKNGEVFPTLISASPLCNAHGQPVGLMGISRDITERKRAEIALRKAHEELEQRVQERTADLMQANAALQAEAAERRLIEADLAKARDEALSSARLKAEFLATMSHEIRTPMNGVLGMTNLLLNTHLTQEQRDCAENIRESADALLKIINDILDFSKIEAGKLTFDVEDFDLVEAVEGTLELLAEPAQSKALELIASIQPDLPTQLRGDPVRLRQVLTNLVSNAVKFTESGEVSLRVQKEAETSSEVVLRIEVRDTGIGIPPEAQGRLFQAFSQADGSTTRRYGGTGLGLVISKQLIAMMHGEVGLDSVPGKGTTFWFTVRLEKQRDPAEARWSHSGIGKRLLVVAVNETFGTAIREQLNAWGFRAETMSDIEQIPASLQAAVHVQDPFSVVLLDAARATVGALDVVRRVRANPRFHSTRIVLFTTLREREGSELWHKAGVDSWLVKPVRQARLFDCLSCILSQPAPGTGMAPSRGAAPARVPDSPVTARRPIRVLIAEDNPINQKVAAGQLKELGYESEIAASGVQVLEALRRGGFDLILMDCQMPVMDGYEATRRIRAGTELSWREIPIVAMTANAMQGDREKCLAAGMNDYLSKPIEEEELKAVLERWQPRDPLMPPRKPAVQRSDRPGDHNPAAQRPDGNALVDLHRLMKVSCGSSARARALMELYLDQTKQALADLRRAIHENASSEVEQIAHRCRGASSTCGVTALLSSLGQLERLGREQSLEGAVGCLSEAACALEKVQAFLDEHLEKASG